MHTYNLFEHRGRKSYGKTYERKSQLEGEVKYMKKIMYIIPAFMFLFVASAAFAFFPMPYVPSNDIKVVNDNHADIDNNVSAISNTGANRLNALGGAGIGVTMTGNAIAANTVQSEANETGVEISAPCTLCHTGDITAINKNRADVDNNVGAIANTGANSLNAGGFFVGGGLQVTGVATSGSLVTTLVNTSVTKITK